MLDTLLGPPAQIWLTQQVDPVRSRLSSALDDCASALAVMDALDLDPVDLEDSDLADLSLWNQSAPRVRDALRSVYACTAALDRTFRDHPQITALVDVIRQDTAAFAMQLRNSAVVASRWSLAGQIQTFKSRVVEGIEAIAAALLEPLSGRHRTSILPRCSTELRRNLDLRDAITALLGAVASEGEQIGRRNDAELIAQIDRHLERFIAEPSFRRLWVLDQRDLLAAKSRMRMTGVALANAVQDLVGLLEILVRTISERADVEAYDRENDELAALLSS